MEIPEEILKQARHVYDVAKDDLESSGELLPKAIVYSETTVAVIVGLFGGQTPDEVEYSKNKFAIYVKTFALAQRAQEVAFVSEAWSVHVEKDKWSEHEEWRKEHYSYQEHPERSEVVLVNLETDQGTLMASFEQKRESPEKSSLVPFEEAVLTWRPVDDTTGSIAGRMAAFLMPKEVRESDRAVAEANQWLELLNQFGGYETKEIPKPTFH